MGCQKWFIDAYRSHGIFFDRIIAWEKESQQQNELWHGAKGYPNEMHPQVTYFNAPVSGTDGDGDNPARYPRSRAIAAAQQPH